MKAIERYTEGQRKALYESLRKQKSPKTPAEVKLYAELREAYAEKKTAPDGATVFFELDGYAKEIGLEVRYRETWAKIKENSDGWFFYSSAQGKKIYI